MRKQLVVLALCLGVLGAAFAAYYFSGAGDEHGAGDAVTRSHAGGMENRFGSNRQRAVPGNVENAAGASSDSWDGEVPTGILGERQRLERAGYRASENIEAAVRELSQLRGRKERRAFVRGMFEHLAAGDKKAAMQAVDALGTGERLFAAKTLMESWRGSDESEMRLEVVNQLDTYRGALEAITTFELDGQNSIVHATVGNNGDGSVAMLGMELLATDPVLAAEWARQFSGTNAADDVLNRAGLEIAKQDPQRALGFATELTGKSRSSYLNSVAEGWARQNALEALAWAGNEADAKVRNGILNSVLRGMAQSDPEGAAKHLGLIGEGPERNGTIARIAAGWATRDAEAAEAWAADLPTEADQKAALASINEAAPVGMGISLRTGNDGAIIVGDVFAQGPAGKSGQLRVNDEIVAVADAGGQMRKMSEMGGKLDEVVKLLRGNRGTSVSLIVRSGGSGEQRTISIRRERFIPGQRE